MSPTSVRIAGRRCVSSPADRGVAALLTAVSWLLQRLPGQVVEDQRPALVKALSQARNLVVEVHIKPSVILIRDGERPLVRIPAG